MTVAQLTALMSVVGKRRPDLVQDRNVRLFVQLCIDEAKAKSVMPNSQSGDTLKDGRLAGPF